MGRTLKEPGQSRALSLPTRRPPITRRRESPQALRVCYQQASRRVHRGQTPSDIFATASALCSSIPDAQDLPVECGTVPKHAIASRQQKGTGPLRARGSGLPSSDDRLRCGCPRIDRLKVPVDDPRRFSRSREGGAHFGLTPREHSSDELIYQGRISKRRDPKHRRFFSLAELNTAVRARLD